MLLRRQLVFSQLDVGFNGEWIGFTVAWRGIKKASLWRAGFFGFRICSDVADHTVHLLITNLHSPDISVKRKVIEIWKFIYMGGRDLTLNSNYQLGAPRFRSDRGAR